MNKKYFIIIAMFISIAFINCSKFLERQESNIDFISSSNFYKDSSQINEAIMGVYSKLRNLYSGDATFWGVTEMAADNTTFEYDPQNRGSLQLENIDYFMETSDNTTLLNLWSNMYNCIAQCNTILDNMDHITYANESNKNIAEGEVRFVRALQYFNLVRLWGNIPLILHQSTQVSDAYNVQTSADSVYTQIMEDVTYAVKNLPAKWESGSVGRTTNGAANTLLGEIYLTRKNFSSAITAFKSVTGYSLISNYADLYNSANKNSSESIFELQYSATVQGQGSNYLYWFAPLHSGFKTISNTFDLNSGNGFNIPTRDFLNSYETGDKRKNVSVTWFVDPLNITNGYVEAQHDSIPYINKYATKPAISGRQDNDFYIYRYADVLLWLAEAINEANGPTQEAYNYVNQVRRRAGLEELNSGLGQTAFRQAIYHEEKIEQAFENHRWFQLVRTGEMVTVMSQNGTAQKKYQTWLPSTGYNLQTYMNLFPIPINEINLNNLTQNQGWK